MNICRACGCSLIRLGISPEDAATETYRDEVLRFCCAGCRDVFRSDPDRYVNETADLAVCPTCLAEKPISMTVAAIVEGQEVRFCRCPGCRDLFQKTPQVFIERLSGRGSFPVGPHCCAT